MARSPSPDPGNVHGAAEVALVLRLGEPAGLAGGYAGRDEITSDSTCIYGGPHGPSRPLRRGRIIRQRNALSVSMSERAAALLHHLLGRSIDRAGCGRDRKFKPLVLGEIQAAGDRQATISPYCGMFFV